MTLSLQGFLQQCKADTPKFKAGWKLNTHNLGVRVEYGANEGDATVLVGVGDAAISPFKVQFEEGHATSVEISSHLRSGSVFYNPEPRLMSAISNASSVTPYRKGEFLNGVLKQIVPNQFAVMANREEISTSTVSGSNNAMHVLHTEWAKHSMAPPRRIGHGVVFKPPSFSIQTATAK